MRKLIVLLTLFATFCGPSEKTKELMRKAKATFGVMPEKMPGSENDTIVRIELGNKLYSDKRLSVNDTQACASCHKLEKHGVDNLPTSPGAFGKKGDRNSPSSFNAGYHIAQFWDGRARDLKEQAKGPILNPGEMAMPSKKAVIDKLAKTEYAELFQSAFPKEKRALTYDNLAEAIAAFERTLRTHDRFDDFQNGDHSALSGAEQKGLELFMQLGCITCHSGNLLGARMYQKIGITEPYANTKDMGRYNVTKEESDKYSFKVPSLRNVGSTAPYFHDGAVKTLDDAVKIMAKLQLGHDLTQDQISSIVKFLESLSNK